MSEQNIEIKCFHQRSELGKLIKESLVHSSTPTDSMMLTSWLQEKTAIGFGLFIREKLISFALLSKCDFDPMEKFTNPYILNYIYTAPGERRKGYGNRLVKHLLKETSLQFTAFCSNDESVRLLEQNGCLNFKEFNNTIMLRSPH